MALFSLRRESDLCAVCEAMVGIVACVLLWIGAWDLIEAFVPGVWYVKLTMVLAASTGLYCIRLLYVSQAETLPYAHASNRKR